MLDSDVAMLYHYQTKRIKETVSRNKERFLEDFCFQLTETEIENLKSQFDLSNIEQENNWSQIVTLNENEGRGKHRKYLPYALQKRYSNAF